jgi:hypothetical protein
MSLRTIVNASIEADAFKAAGRGVANYVMPASDPIVFGSGTGTGKADLAYDADRTLASNTSESIDLAGVLADAFGTTITAAKLKAVEIENPATNTTNITIGGAASNTFLGWFGDATDVIVLKPGDRFVIASPVGWAVTAGTADLLKVANAAGASNTYRIKLIGATA